METDNKAILKVLIGDEDALTGEFSGGMRSALGDVQLNVATHMRNAANGGINAKVKWTFWQKFAIAAIGPVSSILTAIIITVNQQPPA